MASEAQYPVVILYEHALLGEGIAKYLRVRGGVEATVASAHDPEAITSALALDPAVVVFELTEPLQKVGLAALVPHAVLIDVSTVITRGSVSPDGVAGLEQILQAVAGSSTIARPAQCRCPESHPDAYPTHTPRAPHAHTVRGSEPVCT